MDELICDLEYIAASPAPDLGGFHHRVVATAKAALVRIDDLGRDNARLNRKLDLILTDRTYEGGVQYWVAKHDELLLAHQNLLLERAAKF